MGYHIRLLVLTFNIRIYNTIFNILMGALNKNAGISRMANVSSVKKDILLELYQLDWVET